MWLHFFAFQCLVDKHLTQRDTGGCSWLLPKGRYCVSLEQNIRFEWCPLQMVHLCLGAVSLAPPVALLCFAVCFALQFSVCFAVCFAFQFAVCFAVCFACLLALGLFLLLPLPRPRPRFMSPIMTSWSGSAGGVLGGWVYWVGLQSM